MMKRYVTIVTALLMLFMTLAVTLAAPLNRISVTTLTPPPPIPAQQPLTPLVKLVVYDPWRMVIGSDEPRFILYDSGLVIYTRIGPADAPEFVSVQLSTRERDALLADLNIGKDLYVLEANADYFTKTDQPTNVISLYDPLLGEKHVSIYGDLWNDAEARALAAPKPLIDLFDKLVNYTHPDAERWMPETFEVMLWAYDTSDAVAWPRDWPQLDDPTTIKRESVYSLFINFAEYDRYLELRNTANAVRLDGKNWSFAARFPMPHEYPSM